MRTTSEPEATTVYAATAADNGYAMPLAATVRSVLDTLGPRTRLRLFVLDGGLTAQSRRRLERSWRDPRLCLEWLQPDMDAVRHLPCELHLNATSYARLLLPELLPPGVEKIVYFDADMIFRRDLTDLYAEHLGDALALAVQDIAAPWIDAEVACDNFAQIGPHLAAHQPIRNYRELGLRPEAEYFNAGMFVFDVDRWRREGVAERVLACLEEHREHVLWSDQYALNAVLSDRWKRLDLRWNQGAHLFEFPGWEKSTLDREAFERLRDDPWIVHFCSNKKPWQYGCKHPGRDQFFAALDRTDWRGWRPRRTWKQYRRHLRSSLGLRASLDSRSRITP